MGESYAVNLDGEHFTVLISDEEREAFQALLAAAARPVGVIVDLPDFCGGGQILTRTYDGTRHVEGDWRQSAAGTWTPVGLYDGGAVCVAP